MTRFNYSTYSLTFCTFQYIRVRYYYTYIDLLTIWPDVAQIFHARPHKSLKINKIALHQLVFKQNTNV